MGVAVGSAQVVTDGNGLGTGPVRPDEFVAEHGRGIEINGQGDDSDDGWVTMESAVSDSVADAD